MFFLSLSLSLLFLFFFFLFLISSPPLFRWKRARGNNRILLWPVPVPRRGKEEEGLGTGTREAAAAAGWFAREKKLLFPLFKYGSSDDAYEFREALNFYGFARRKLVRSLCTRPPSLIVTSLLLSLFLWYPGREKRNGITMPLNTWKNFHRFYVAGQRERKKERERNGSCVKRVKCNILFTLFSLSLFLSFFFFGFCFANISMK